ncbi:MAG: amidohydrolase family protein [Puniceicoccales bacterium]
MIINGQLLLPAGERSVDIQPGWIRIEEDRICEVQVGEMHPQPDLGDESYLVTPGFIDTHLHLPQIDSFGAFGERLLDWLQGTIFPAEIAWADPDYAKARGRSAMEQLFACGTTGIVAFASNHFESTRRALETADEIGMRASIGQTLCDMEITPELLIPTGESLRQARDLLEAYPPGGERVTASIAPRFALTCTGELLSGCGELAREFGAIVQTHLAEMEPECERACELHGAPDYTRIYEQAGLLTERSLFGHSIHLSGDERRRLAAAGSKAAHCPTSNTFLRSGVMNRAQCLRDGYGVTLATDQCAGYEKSMIRVARSMLEVTMFVGETPPSEYEAWWQITAGNAQELGWADSGVLREGAEADVVLIQPEHPWYQLRRPLSDLLWTFDDRWLKKTIANGRVVYSQ